MEQPRLSEYTNRSHPMFEGQNCLNTLNLGITTVCTMKCPNCTVNVPGIAKARKAQHALMSTIFRDAVHMQGLRRIHVTGGEPTLHPFFLPIVQQLSAWFQNQYTTIETNGAGYMKYRALFQQFDLVFITHYEPGAVYDGSPGNTDVICQAQSDLGDRLIVEEPVRHLPAHVTIQQGLTLKDYSLPEDEKPCSKFFDPGLPAAWYNGKLYRCCVSFGIDETLGISVDKDWREKITQQKMGCGVCSFRGT